MNIQVNVGGNVGASGGMYSNAGVGGYGNVEGGVEFSGGGGYYANNINNNAYDSQGYNSVVVGQGNYGGQGNFQAGINTNMGSNAYYGGNYQQNNDLAPKIDYTVTQTVVKTQEVKVENKVNLEVDASVKVNANANINSNANVNVDARAPDLGRTEITDHYTDFLICGIAYPILTPQQAVCILVLNIFFPGLGTQILGCLDKDQEGNNKNCCCWYWIGIFRL